MIAQKARQTPAEQDSGLAFGSGLFPKPCIARILVGAPSNIRAGALSVHGMWASIRHSGASVPRKSPQREMLDGGLPDRYRRSKNATHIIRSHSLLVLARREVKPKLPFTMIHRRPPTPPSAAARAI